MNIKNLFSLLVFFVILTGSVMAQQPFGGCWHPENIIKWTPESDLDAKFNRSTVKLQPRFKNKEIKANINQFYDGQISACLTMHPSCSQTPSQGANNFIGYNPTYWQYLDVLVWWAGSAGEGIIIPPSAPVTDIAHLNGVKVLGQIFFPPSAFGGQSKWVAEMLTEEGGKFPYAEKIYQIAAYYGFDGWFINEETLTDYNDKWKRFFKYYFQLADADGNSHHEIQWYDMHTYSDDKKDIFKEESRFSYFSNYGSPSSASGNKTKFASWGIEGDRYFKQMYHGVECAQGGYTGNESGFKSCFTKSGHNGSLDLFNPEETIWKTVVQNQLGTEDACGSVAYEKMKTVFERESRFWTNAASDPSNTDGFNTGGGWPGLANAMMERSAITTKPFVTSFSAGLGKYRFVNGVKQGTQDWYHRGMQDVMPTWRWWIENNNGLKIDLNWDDAYNTGTSLKVTGALTAGTNYLTRLYKTQLSIVNNDKFQLVYKGDIADTEVKLATLDAPTSFVTFPLNSAIKTDANGWTVATIDLSSLNGKTLSVIALNFKSNAGTTLNLLLGQLGVLEGNYVPASLKVSNLKVQKELQDEVSDIRLIWDNPTDISNLHHYNVYTYRNNVKNLVGQTRNEGFYIPKFQRVIGEQKVDIYVVAVMKDMKESAEQVKLTLNYPALQLSGVSLSASKTLVRTGEEVTLTAKADRYPELYTWVVPEGAELISGQGTSKAVFKFTTQKKFNISVTVKNAAGNAVKEITDFIEVSNNKVLDKVSCGATIVSASGSLPPEDPRNLVDCVWIPGNIRAKWCIGGKKEHWVILDLKAEYDIYQFRWADCGHKENYSDNVQCYKIELSLDNVNWTTVLNEKGRPENTKEDFIKPTKGRYVRFTPYDEEKPITIRIWEFEVYSVATTVEVTAPTNVEMNMGATLAQTAAYNLNGSSQASDFKAVVTSSNSNAIEVTDVAVSNGTIAYNLKAKKGGVAIISISIQNSGKVSTATYQVSSVDPSIVNILQGKTPILETVEESTEGTLDLTTDGDKGTSWKSGYSTDGNMIHTLSFDLGKYYDISTLKAFINKKNVDIWLETVSVKVYLAAHENGFEEIANWNSKGLNDNNVLNLNEAKTARYVKFEFETTPANSVKIFELEVYGKEGVLKETRQVPMIVTSGFNGDVIAEAKPSVATSNMPLDDQGWVLFNANVQAEGAIPANGKLTSSNGINYQLADATRMNAAVMTKTTPNTCTLAVSNGDRAEAIYLLSISANGNAKIEVVANYDDATTSNPATFTLKDWWQGSSAGTAVYGLSRIIREASYTYPADDIDNRLQFCLCESKVVTDPTKNITSITITSKNSSAYPTVFAVTKEYMETVSGIENMAKIAASISVYPNPISNGEILKVETTDAYSIQLISLQGSILLQKRVTNHVTELPINGVSTGTYLLIVKGENGIQTSKVIIK